MEKCCGFIYRKSLHHLDHLAALCQFLNIPLVFTSASLEMVAKTFYPSLKTLCFSELNFATEILRSFDTLFSALPEKMLAPLFFFEEALTGKKLITCWLPHGNSDKDNLEGLVGEKRLLTYGPQMETILRNKGILTEENGVTIGNLRAHLFHNFPLKEEKKKKFHILYAPTWNARDVLSDLSTLLQNLPSDCFLTVKLHPNTLDNPRYIGLKELYAKKSNLSFLETYPLIFPLLKGVDLLLTDGSSVAYDFLYFDRPIFFLQNKITPLLSVGYLTSGEHFYRDIEKSDDFSEKRKSLYLHAFSDEVDYKELPSKIEDLTKTATIDQK